MFEVWRDADALDAWRAAANAPEIDVETFDETSGATTPKPTVPSSRQPFGSVRRPQRGLASGRDRAQHESTASAALVDPAGERA